MSKTRRGFTLVELLAVIVVLGLILLIAVPQVMNVINDSKKGVLESSARLIANSAENIKLSNDTMGIKTEIQCSDVSKISKKDYKDCTIDFVNGEARVTIIGQGKYEGMVVCKATSEEAKAIEGECPGDGGSIAKSAVGKIESLATESNTEGLITDDFGNIRYAGSSPKNYIKFNDEDWRIIGIFNMTTVGGNTEKLMKIVRNESIGTYSGDSSASDVNGGYGVNEWSQSDLKAMLNTYYIGTSTTCRYCDDVNQSTCSNDCSIDVTPIGSTYVSMIEDVVWNTGSIKYADSIERRSAYTQERGTTTGKECESGDYCNDSVTRTTTWEGKIGLIYPSDYGYASTSSTDIRNTSSSTSNWLKSSSTYWTITPYNSSSKAHNAWVFSSNNYVSDRILYDVNDVRPAIYLKSDVSITSGDGSSSLPYQISMN